MALLSCLINSDVMEQKVNLDVFLPTDSPEEKGREIAGVLYLLHGLGGSHKDWQSYTAVIRYAVDNRLAVIFPSARKSFYANMVYGDDFYTFMTEELPDILQKMFRLPNEREKTFIAGLSMGGYGATYLGLSRPDLYGAFANFSGPMNIRLFEQMKDNEMVQKDFVPVFGDNVEIDDKYDLYKLAEKVAQLPEKERPRIFMACGKQDNYGGLELYEQNVDYKAHIEKLPYVSKWMEWDGIHEYSFWDRALVHAISFFLNNKYDEEKLKDWQ